MCSAAEFKNVEEIQKEIGEWAKNTFPIQEVGAKIEHLKREVAELEECPDDGEEMADCAILLFGIAYLQNVDLLEEVRKKLEKNKKRSWAAPDDQGVYKHI